MAFTASGNSGNKLPSIIFNVNVETIRVDEYDAIRRLCAEDLSRTLGATRRAQI